MRASFKGLCVKQTASVSHQSHRGMYIYIHENRLADNWGIATAWLMKASLWSSACGKKNFSDALTTPKSATPFWFLIGLIMTLS
jgi:hypothetical protein